MAGVALSVELLVRRNHIGSLNRVESIGRFGAVDCRYKRFVKGSE